MHKSWLLVCLLASVFWGCGEDADTEPGEGGAEGTGGVVGAGGAGGMAGAAGAGGMAGAGGAGGMAGAAGAGGMAGAGGVGGTAGEGGEGGAMVPDCVPHDDMCPEAQYCQYTDGRLQCIDNGDVVPDPQFHYTPECAMGVCSRGGICHDRRPGEVLGGLNCYWVCDPADVGGRGDCPNGRHTCFQATDAEGSPLPFAICDY